MPEIDEGPLLPGQPAGDARAPQARGSIEATLRAGIESHGPVLLYEADQLEIYLLEHCPDAHHDIGLLLAALEEQVPQELLSAHSAGEIDALVSRLEQRMTERRALNLYASNWAVRTWAEALGLRDAVPVPVEPTGADASVASLEPAFETDARGAVTADAAAPIRYVDDEIVPATLPPLSSESTLPPAGSAASATSDEANASDEAHDPRPLPKQPAARSSRVWYGVAGVLVALGVALAANRLVGPMHGSEPPPVPDTTGTPVVASARIEAPEPSPAPSPSPPRSPSGPVASGTPTGSTAAASPTAGAPDRRLPDIVEITTGEPLVGDGRERDVLVSVLPGRLPVRAVESRFVAGDGPWDPRPVLVELADDVPQGGPLPAGRIGLRTTRPVDMTFEYVAIAADGARGAPFRKTFSFAPLPAQAPSIVDIAVPVSVVAGKPFSLTIAYREGDGKLVSVERKLVDVAANAITGIAVVEVSRLPSPTAGTLRFPVAAIRTATHNTMEFTLIDGDGRRSDPRRVEFDIASPRVASAHTQSASPPGPPAAAALGVCARTSCGVVVGVRSVETSYDDGVGARVVGAIGRLLGQTPEPVPRTYYIVIRLDDGAMRDVEQSTPLRNGSRVQLAGNRFVPLSTRSRGRQHRQPESARATSP